MSILFDSPPIAFVSRIPDTEAQQWLIVLNTLLPDNEVCLFDSLTTRQKQQCSLAVVANPDPAELRQLPNLQWVHSTWAGVERMVAELSVADSLVNDPLIKSTAFPIVRLIDPTLAHTMAEAVLAWTLYLHRDMPAYRAQQSAAQWLQRPYIAASERTVGVLGLGKLGALSAERLHANGFNVLGWSRHDKSFENIQTFAAEEGLSAMLAQSDIVINLLPLTDQTRGLLSTARFAQCKQGVSLINFGRGPTMNQADLITALGAGIVSHAVLDVFYEEPLPVNHPYWSHADITILPHISAPTSISSASKIVANNIREYYKTGRIPEAVDRQLGY
ncbi:2-hydroxyacid dehydrogenase [Neptunomonas antarctica]|uniref:Glyoxylate/hydroxypyruvate reductase A n=1 Tax=Neptunomonas antarctica TaxID=619304 RepID=A0A1N7K1B3_9GAMM|nr:glyoxylate/hydroxypyruvate reductase A [Neptunomonas antarctica]SIS55372.1 glyoxylate/hydroxypyruvate reductase A [Neptunomonas antarctica]